MNEQFYFLRSEPQFAFRKYIKEKEDILRSKFDRDRDRILFSKEFRRLEGKTQVFVNGFDDHIRNRLTHTLEVSQIGQSISKYFGFNRTLTEAIALSHDVGHTPFGHVGERILNFFTNNCETYKDFKISNESEKGFKHNWQGLKVVSTLEKINPNYQGLNLTDYTLWGILHHSKLKYRECGHKSGELCNYNYGSLTKKCHLISKEFSLSHYKKFNNLLNKNSWSFEAVIINNADEIAQRHHDIEDGLIANIINIHELVDIFRDLFDSFLSTDQKKKLTTIKKSENINYVLHDLSSLILGFYSIQLFSNTEINFKKIVEKYNIKTSFDFMNSKDSIYNEEDIFKIMTYSDDFMEKDKEFQKYLINRILNSHLAQTMDGKASYILRNIIQAYLTNPKQLPDSTIKTLMKNYLSAREFNSLVKNKSNKLAICILRDEVNKISNGNDDRFKTILIRTITDFIAGMTDKFALSQYRMLYGSDNYWLK